MWSNNSEECIIYLRGGNHISCNARMHKLCKFIIYTQAGQCVCWMTHADQSKEKQLTNSSMPWYMYVQVHVIYCTHYNIIAHVHVYCVPSYSPLMLLVFCYNLSRTLHHRVYKLHVHVYIKTTYYIELHAAMYM